MAAQTHAIDVPPVEVAVSEFVANLAMLAHAYLEPALPLSSSKGQGDEALDEAKPDLVAAEIAIDVAGKAFDRIQSRLGPQERSAVARVLTELRLSYVKKRGQ
jgi:hypothetical protein